MKKKIFTVVIAAAMAITMLAGCKSGSSGSETPGNVASTSTGKNSTSTTNGSTASSESSGEEVSLVVWDTFTEDAMSKASEEIIEMFEKAYPNIKIERVSKTLDAMDETLKAGFMSGDAPDVIYHEMGIGEMGDFTKAGYLLNLADAYKSYGWNDTIMAVSSQVPSIDDIIYGVGSEIETMSLYYNKAIFDELGLDEPATIEELTDCFAKIKDAGYIPLANTLDTQWSNNMNFIGTIMYAFMSQDEIKASMNEDASWDLESVRQAIVTIKDWIDKGYFPAHPEVDGDQEVFFTTQEAACWVTGNWSIANINSLSEGEFETAIIPFPGSQNCPDGGSQVNYVGSGYMVSALSKHQEAALNFVNFSLNNQDTAVVWSEVGNIIPPYNGEFDADIPEKLTEVTDYLSDPDISNIAGINMWLGTNSFEFFSDAGQKLVIGALDTESFIKEAEAARLADIEEGNTKASFSLD